MIPSARLPCQVETCNADITTEGSDAAAAWHLAGGAPSQIPANYVILAVVAVPLGERVGPLPLCITVWPVRHRQNDRNGSKGPALVVLPLSISLISPPFPITGAPAGGVGAGARAVPAAGSGPRGPGALFHIFPPAQRLRPSVPPSRRSQTKFSVPTVSFEAARLKSCELEVAGIILPSVRRQREIKSITRFFRSMRGAYTGRTALPFTKAGPNSI